MIIIMEDNPTLGRSMERSSGLKECPRCGLRNRQGAYQCDFCGWDFKAATDDWMGQVNDLERIGRDVELSDMDTSVRSRIELTMKRPAEMPVAEKSIETRLELPPDLSLEDRGDDIVHAAVDSSPDTPPETVPEMTEAEAPAAAPQPALVQDDPIRPPMEASAEPVKPGEAVRRLPLRTVRTPQFVPGGLLAMGIGVYVLDIYVVSAGILTGALAWGVSIVASALMVYAVIRYLPMVTRGKRKDEDEAVLCPVCHEVVTDSDNKCPSCGVRFRKAPSKE